jgi:beta-xylosidase
VDGLKWAALNNDQGYIKPQVGSQKIMRDPCILPGPDGEFRMVWTTGWQGRDIGYAHSKDLIHWSEQKAIPVMEHEPEAKNCWAPEVVYDDAKQQYIIFWATTITDRFPETKDSGGNGNNHRIYCTKTKDFETFSKSEVFFDPGFEVIDATMLRNNGKWCLFFKDETAVPKPMKHILIAESASAEGPFEIISNAFSPHWVEGPTVTKWGDWYICYFDMYRAHNYGAMRSKDLKTWEDVTTQLALPSAAKHGTVFQVPKTVVENLMRQ